MDTFAHAVWAGIVAKAHNQGRHHDGQSAKKVSVRRTVWWGIFPDLVAFIVPIIITVILLVSGDISWTIFRTGPPSLESSPMLLQKAFALASFIYQITHSLIVLTVVIGGTWLITRRIPWALSGWLVHILMDIPTHPIDAFPTPFLWPLFDWRFPYGGSWGVPWFMIVNYSVMLILFVTFVIIRIRNSKTA